MEKTDGKGQQGSQNKWTNKKRRTSTPRKRERERRCQSMRMGQNQRGGET
jgi:ribosomal protein L3